MWLSMLFHRAFPTFAVLLNEIFSCDAIFTYAKICCQTEFSLKIHWIFDSFVCSNILTRSLCTNRRLNVIKYKFTCYNRERFLWRTTTTMPKDWNFNCEWAKNEGCIKYSNASQAFWQTVEMKTCWNGAVPL